MDLTETCLRGLSCLSGMDEEEYVCNRIPWTSRKSRSARLLSTNAPDLTKEEKSDCDGSSVFSAETEASVVNRCKARQGGIG